jgi:predicted oxidoreductase
MAQDTTYRADVLIIGGGLAGIIAALELLDAGKSVIILDRDKESAFGGLAKWAFGGMFFVDTKHQRRNGIRDSIDLALKDWFSFAEFPETEFWGRRWAEQYVHLCTPQGYHWLRRHGIGFFPVLNWVERGLDVPGNSVPRFHMVWGTGWELTRVFREKLLHHRHRDRLQLYFGHRALELLQQGDAVIGVTGTREVDDSFFKAEAGHTIVATGGINGNLDKVRQHWHRDWGKPPAVILNGAHKYALGDLHEATERINGQVSNLDWQWNYAAGVRHYAPRKPEHGLSLVPCKTALWLNYRGERIGPRPLITAYDTRYLVSRICAQEEQYSWQVLNYKIACKEFAISGSEHNPAIRDKKPLSFVLSVLRGNRPLVDKILAECEDVIAADTLPELVDKMNALTGQAKVELPLVEQAVRNYDASIAAGPPYQDEQQQLIHQARQWRGDKARTANMVKIADPKSGPFIAIREFILSRKSLGGIQTNLHSQVLSKASDPAVQQPIPGLYAIGEAAGFGGGGMHGHRSLEGTFLGGVVITARVAAAAILGKTLTG